MTDQDQSFLYRIYNAPLRLNNVAFWHYNFNCPSGQVVITWHYSLSTQANWPSLFRVMSNDWSRPVNTHYTENWDTISFRLAHRQHEGIHVVLILLGLRIVKNGLINGAPCLVSLWTNVNVLINLALFRIPPACLPAAKPQGQRMMIGSFLPGNYQLNINRGH